MYEHINNGGKGCCFVFSAYMMKCLYDNGIEASMISTPEGNGIRASILYRDEEELYVANPVNDIEYFTEHKIPSYLRNSFYEDTILITKDNKKLDSSRILVKDFADMYGKIKEIGSFKDDDSLKIKMQNAKYLQT